MEKQLKVEHNIRLSEMDKSIAATLGLRYVSDTDRSSVAGPSTPLLLQAFLFNNLKTKRNIVKLW